MVVWASQVKNLPASAGDTGYMSLIPALARSPGEGNGNPLQHSCLENPMDRGAWWAAVHGVTKIWTWLSDYTTTKYIYTSEYCAAFKAVFSKTILFPAHLPVFWATYLFPLSPPESRATLNPSRDVSDSSILLYSSQCPISWADGSAMT